MFRKQEFFDNIQKKAGLLSLSKRKAANYVLKSYQKAAFMTAKEIAEKCSVSESTVNRFCAGNAPEEDGDPTFFGCTRKDFESIPGDKNSLFYSLMNWRICHFG